MASGPSNGQLAVAHPQLEFYPAYCYKASPTYFTWVKLTASDIHHALRSRPGFSSHNNNNNNNYNRQQHHEPTSLLFYLNHPVQFVCVAGIVVAFDDHEFSWVFTVDDSSGATIDVACRKPEKSKAQDDKESAQYGGNAVLAQATKVEAREGEDDGVVDEVNARAEMLSRIDVGIVVKVKGTISTFRSVRQIALERLEIIPHTTAEVRLWTQRTKLFSDVLSKPWTLSTEEQKRLLKEAEGEVEDTRGRAVRRAERLAKEQRREKRHAEQVAKAYEVEERERGRVAEQARQDGLRLHVDLEQRECESATKKAKNDESVNMSKEEPRNGRITDLRELLLSK